MRSLALLLIGCGHTHVESVSVAELEADEARAKAQIAAMCAPLPERRRDVCLRIGPPLSPDAEQWATASWWYYEWRQSGPENMDITRSAVWRCSQFVAFRGDVVEESDSQCRVVARYR